MKMIPKLLTGVASLALLAASLSTVRAQTTSTNATDETSPSASSTAATQKEDEPIKLETFVVSSLRGSLASAAEIKQSHQSIVDSIVASDIDKLPDINVSYALSRIPGIQVAHTFAGLGGNGAVTIHGLTQVANTIDGREVFTPGGASGGGIANGQRTFDYSQIPSALIAGIDVYKTSAADQLDGGLGGLIDVRLRKPFDFASGLQGSVAAGMTYNDLANSARPNYNLFVSDSGMTKMGKVGALISVGYNISPWREDNIGVGNPTAMSSLVTGTPGALAGNGYNLSSSWGTFETFGYHTEVQWQPNEHLQFYAGANHNQWWNVEQQVSFLIGLPASAAVAGSGVMFSGDNVAVKSATFHNVTGTSYSVIRDLADRSTTTFIGGKWTSDNLTVNFDLSHFVAAYEFLNNGFWMSATIPSLTYDLGGTVPSAYVTGASLMDPSLYQAQQVIHRLFPSRGQNTVGKVDAEYNVSSGFLTKILAGVRYAQSQQDDSNLGLYLGGWDIPAAQKGLNNFPGLISASPSQNFFTGYSEPQPMQYLSSTLWSTFRDPATMLKTFGAPASVTPTNIGLYGTPNPLNFYDITEKTTAVYVMPKFEGKIGNLPYDGNVGLRAVQTKEETHGNQTINPGTAQQGIGPILISSSYTDYLPSANFRLKFTPTIFLRMAASKTITRPSFNQISPSLTLNRNPLNPAANSGSQGNPALKPVRSTNYDVSLEDYFNKDSVVYLAGFYKDVTGFIANVSNPMTVDGVTYQVTTPGNLNPATIKGAEAGYHQFFTFLPAPFDGLGLQANYTLVKSSTPSTIQGYNIPLTNLSEKSYNVVAMYEKGGFSARVAYNWRDKYVTGISNFVGVGPIQQVVRSYGDLDASLNYNFTKNLQLSIQGVNLTNSIRYQFWGSERFPSNVYLDGTTLMANISYRY